MSARRATQSGATLLEAVAVLVVLAVVSVGVMHMLHTSVEGMLLARDEAAAAENIQAALTRITHELANMDTKRPYAFSGTGVTYYYKDDAAQSVLALSGTTLTLDGNVLLGNLVPGTGFQVTSPNYLANPAVPAGFTVRVNVPSRNGTVTKVYTMRVEFNTQRFQ